ncbi:ribonuclease E inhibitor RraB [Arthrobacter sp. NPDC056886]|uniref:ribonuclease E inhibitor RraB n=1 Tax=Arthrobacter sp. NPDC056886 TaxID=3345960 RepID=UPI00366D0D7A
MTDFSDKVAHQARLSAEQLRQRADLNDALDVARPVDHSGVFPDLEGASAACAELTSAGYLTTVSGEGEILVEAQNISTVDPDAVRAFTGEVLAIFDRHGGEYDGWGAPVESVLVPHPRQGSSRIRRALQGLLGPRQ